MSSSGKIAKNVDTTENKKNKRKVLATSEEVDIKKMKLDESENVAIIADKPKGKKKRNKRKKNVVLQNGNTGKKTETEGVLVSSVGGSPKDEDKTDDSTKNSTETIVDNGEAPKKRRKNRGKRNHSKVQENGGSPKKSRDNVSKDADKSEVKQDSAEKKSGVKVSTKRMKKRLKAGKKFDKKSGGPVKKNDEAINTGKKKSKKSKANKKKALNSKAIAT